MHDSSGFAGGMVNLIGQKEHPVPRNEEERRSFLVRSVAEGVALDAIKRTKGFQGLVQTIVARIEAEQAAIQQLADGLTVPSAGA